MFDIKKQRENLRLSQEELANKVGVTKATISKWEQGKIENMKRDKISKLAKVLKVSPLVILGMEELGEGRKVKVPILGTITCGEPILAIENFDGYIEELEDELPSGDLFYLRTKGDSMSPTIPDGANVLIRLQPEVEEGEIAAVLLNSDTEATLKRVKHQGNMVLLLPDNNKYEPYIITPENPARIIGKAIKVSFNL